jgi:hypothetical protein
MRQASCASLMTKGLYDTRWASGSQVHDPALRLQFSERGGLLFFLRLQSALQSHGPGVDRWRRRLAPWGRWPWHSPDHLCDDRHGGARTLPHRDLKTFAQSGLAQHAPTSVDP